MDNQFFIIKALNSVTGMKKILKQAKELLDSGFEIKRCYTTNNAFLIHIAKVEEEDIVEEAGIESVIEIALDDNPLTIKEWTDDGWLVKQFYSKKVQLIKMKELE